MLFNVTSVFIIQYDT